MAMGRCRKCNVMYLEEGGHECVVDSTISLLDPGTIEMIIDGDPGAKMTLNAQSLKLEIGGTEVFNLKKGDKPDCDDVIAGFRAFLEINCRSVRNRPGPVLSGPNLEAFERTCASYGV